MYLCVISDVRSRTESERKKTLFFRMISAIAISGIRNTQERDRSFLNRLKLHLLEATKSCEQLESGSFHGRQVKIACKAGNHIPKEWRAKSRRYLQCNRTAAQV